MWWGCGGGDMTHRVCSRTGSTACDVIHLTSCRGAARDFISARVTSGREEVADGILLERLF